MSIAKRSAWPAVAALAMAALTTTSAIAQSGNQENVRPGEERFEPGETVRDRSQPDYDPAGIKFGGFVLNPSFTVKETYDSNVYYDPNDTKSDFVTTLAPKLELVSQWSQHELKLSAGADVVRYAEYDGENVENYVLNANGRLDVLRSTRIDLRAAAEHLHEERGSPDDADADQPTPFRRYSAGTTVRYQPSRLLVEASGDVTKNDFKDVDRTGGTTINNDDRDRVQTNASLKTGYEIVPEYLAFLRVEFNDRNYDSAVDDAGVNRDSNGYRAEVGTDVDLGGLVVGDVGVGYLWQNYDDSQLTDIQGYSATANLYWHVTPLSTVYGQFSRSIQETTVAGASGYISTKGIIGVDHELLRNLVLGASASYTSNDFRGITRDDDLYGVALSADYRPNRTVQVSTGIGYDVRDSTDATAEYDRATIFLSVRLAL